MMVNFTLVQLEDFLWQASLYGALWVVLHGIPQSNHHFYAVLERNNPETCTFFTPVEEMGFILNEMYEVSGLMMRDIPYEEYIPSTEELHLLKKDVLLVYETYWEVLCYFHICVQMTGWRYGGFKLLAWVSYLSRSE